ncbi:MAG: hemin uptake protein HemP [Pseudomonadota bacterium]
MNRDGPSRPQTKAESQNKEARDLGALIKSEDLFGKERQISIAHQGELYRLRITAQGKLILNK